MLQESDTASANWRLVSHRTSKRVALWFGITAVLAVLTALVVFRRQLTEEYYIWRSASRDPAERSNAVARLSEIGSSRCLPALVKVVETETEPARWARAAMVITQVASSNTQSTEKFLAGLTENAVVQARLLARPLVLVGCDGFVGEFGLQFAGLAIQTIGSLGGDAVSSVAQPLREAARCQYEEVRLAARAVLQRFALTVD